ncbi:MAG: ATP phosphoribosyltransferase [Hyphomicrobiaceae bacterium]
MSAPLILAVPSKGRLMEDTSDVFAKGGMTIAKTGNGRGYRGEITGIDGVEISFVSASEIAKLLRSGEVHMGVTGEDLVREMMADADQKVEFASKLGFGHADVIVAVPEFWIDVRTMADLEEAAVLYRRRHGARMRVATKYTGLTRRYFAGERFGGAARSPAHVSMYRIVESLGATEGAPAAGTAELIVDITSTGSTLKANGLRILDDGIILKSEANLVASRTATWSEPQQAARAALLTRLAMA